MGRRFKNSARDGHLVKSLQVHALRHSLYDPRPSIQAARGGSQPVLSGMAFFRARGTGGATKWLSNVTHALPFFLPSRILTAGRV